MLSVPTHWNRLRQKGFQCYRHVNGSVIDAGNAVKWAYLVISIIYITICVSVQFSACFCLIADITQGKYWKWNLWYSFESWDPIIFSPFVFMNIHSEWRTIHLIPFNYRIFSQTIIHLKEMNKLKKWDVEIMLKPVAKLKHFFWTHPQT